MKSSESFIEYCKSLFIRLANMLSVNLGWKIFSLFLAICFWFVVINMTNPRESWSFSMKLTLSGVENLAEYHDVVVKNQKSLEGTDVSVKIRGNRLDLEALNKLRSNIIASGNLGVIYDFTMNGDVRAPIDIIFPTIPGVAPDAFEVISMSPQYAWVTLEEIVTEEKPVRVSLHGDVAEGYVALSPEVTPETVKLRGPRSKLNQIDQVIVETELSGETSDISVSLPPKLIGHDFQEVADVDCFTDMVDVLIKIDKYMKVPVFASYVGEPPEGYTVTDIKWEPTHLEIVGSGEEVSSFKEVRLIPVNVDGHTETNVSSFDIRNFNILPENVSIKNGTPNKVTVTVTIEEIIQKNFDIPVSMLITGTMSPGYSYNILDNSIVFAVEGISSAISALSEDNISLRLNLSGYEPGDNLIPVEVQLPSGISVVGEAPKVNINITRAALPGDSSGASGETDGAAGEPDGTAEDEANQPDSDTNLE